MEKGADVSIKTKQRDCVLHLFLWYSEFSDDFINTVIEKSPVEFLSMRSTLGLTPIMMEAQGGRISCLKHLLNCGKGAINVDDIDNLGRTALGHAAMYDVVESIDVLIQFGADKEYFPVEDLKRKYTKKGRSFGFEVKSPLMLASTRGKVKCVEQLIKLGDNVQSDISVW